MAAEGGSHRAETGDLVGRAAALHGLARLGHPEEADAPLRDLASGLEGPLIQARASHVKALCDGDVDALAPVAAEFAAMGADLLAAEAPADTAVAARRPAGQAPTDAALRSVGRLLNNHCLGAVTPALQGRSSGAPHPGRA